MQSHFEVLFEAAGDRYPQPEDLSLVTQYVASIPERLKTYQRLRDQELAVMQQIADQLPEHLPAAADAELEQSLIKGALTLRYCAMGLLLNDVSFVQARITSWLSEALLTEPTQADRLVYDLMTQQLNRLLSASQQALFHPMFAVAIELLVNAETAEPELTLAAMF